MSLVTDVSAQLTRQNVNKTSMVTS